MGNKVFDSFPYNFPINRLKFFEHFPIYSILLPGGSAPYVRNNTFIKAAKHIFEIAKEMNDNGIYFPIFGICQGYETLLYLSLGQQQIMTNCGEQLLPSTLDFTNGMLIVQTLKALFFNSEYLFIFSVHSFHT